MRICTWNMNRMAPERAWRFVLERIDPDIAFVQEAPEPKNIPPGQVIWKRIGANSRFGDNGRYYWATGIYSKERPLRQLTAGKLGDGWVVAAETELRDRILTLISIHVEPRIEGRYTKTLEWILQELTPLLRETERLIVLGGDLNVDPFFDKGRRIPHHRLVLELVQSFGLAHCNRLLPDGARTFRNHAHPIQDDHFFASTELFARGSCHVVDDDEIEQLSDHYPLVLELNSD